MYHPIPAKIIDLLDAMTLDDLDTLPPVYRERFMQRCKRWADLAAQPPGAAAREPKSYAVIFQRAVEATRAIAGPKSTGVLVELRKNPREG